MMLPSVSVPTPTAARFAAIAVPRARSWSRRDCGRARRDSSSARRGAPARGRTRRAEVGPLAEVGLAEDHRAGGAQALHEERIAARAGCRRARASRRSSPSARRRCCPSAAPGCRAAGRARCRPCVRHRARRLRSSASGLSSMTAVERRARPCRSPRCDPGRPASARGSSARPSPCVCCRPVMSASSKAKAGTVAAAGAPGLAGVGVAVFWAASRGWQPVAARRARASKARRMASFPGRRPRRCRGRRQQSPHCQERLRAGNSGGRVHGPIRLGGGILRHTGAAPSWERLQRDSFDVLQRGPAKARRRLLPQRSEGA